MYRCTASIARLTALSVAAFSLLGCFPSPGPCDENAAREIVYTHDGTPAYAGQAVMQVSCGNGGFCHSESGDDGIRLEDRFGAPAGLGFDVGIAATIEENCPTECLEIADDDAFLECCRTAPSAGQRLQRHRALVQGQRGPILGQVQSGDMPPSGDVLIRYRAQIPDSQRFDRIADDGITPTRLPALIDEDPADRARAQEILRNWLACDAPVVERTLEHRFVDNFAGDTVADCERTCVDVTWPSIFEQIIEPSCTASECHDSEFPAAMLELTELAAGHAQLLGPGATGQLAQGSQCGPDEDNPARIIPMLVVPGDPDASLLIQKVEAPSNADVCGSRMPAAGSPLSEQRRCVLRQWVLLGACSDPDDAACSANLAMARAACGSDPTTESGCATPTLCDNGL